MAMQKPYISIDEGWICSKVWHGQVQPRPILKLAFIPLLTLFNYQLLDYQIILKNEHNILFCLDSTLGVQFKLMHLNLRPNHPSWYIDIEWE